MNIRSIEDIANMIEDISGDVIITDIRGNEYRVDAGLFYEHNHRPHDNGEDLVFIFERRVVRREGDNRCVTRNNELYIEAKDIYSVMFEYDEE